MAKAQDLREQSDEQLKALCEDLRKEVYQMKNALALRKDNVKAEDIRHKRKSIARVLTILSERQMQLQ